MTLCLVTRPAAQAGAWVTALREAGLDARAMPLIAIAPALDPSAVHQAWRDMNRYDALMFVSANAVSHFLAARPPDLSWQKSLFESLQQRPCWVTGPGSAAALRKAGVPESAINAPTAAHQFDSEALWARIAPNWRPGTRVLIVRGDHAESDEPSGTADATAAGVGREWLAQQIVGQGGTCDFVVAYRRTVPDLSPEERACLQTAAQDRTVWIFSSSEALHNLQQLLPGQSWQLARAVATHPRIAEQAVHQGFGQVRTARPVLADLIASIESLL